MDDTERYPDVPTDADGFDAIVRVLSEIDQPHKIKSALLAAAAYTEFTHAVEDGELPADLPFQQFAAEAVEKSRDAIEALDE